MLNLQSTFKDIGGFGAYQILVCIAGTIASCYNGVIFAGGAFNNLVFCSDQQETANGTWSASSNESVGLLSKHGFRTSVSIEYGLCDKLGSMGELSSVFLLAGYIPGSLLVGPAADTLGRIAGVLIGLLCSVAMNILATFSPYFWLHLASRLVCGFFVSWTIGSMFVYGNEVLMTEHRSRFVKAYNLGTPVGCILVACLAYILCDYKLLMTANNFVAIPLLLIVVFLPESPSWLASQKSKSRRQVKRALSRIAWINRRPLPQSVDELRSLQAIPPISNASDPIAPQPEVSSTNKTEATKGGSLWTEIKTLMSDRRSVFYLVSTCLYSFSSGLAYYGFTFVITHAVPNVYITMILMGALEPPSLLLLNIFSRGQTLFFSALLTALSSFAIGVIFVFVDADAFTVGISVAMVGLAVSGKLASNVAFCTVVAFGAEIYPTTVRNTGLGILLATLRTGCMLSPLVNFIPYMPARFAALGLGCLLTAFPTRSLPDTRMSDLTSNFTAADPQPVPAEALEESPKPAEVPEEANET